VAKSRIVVALVVFERTIAEGRVVCGAVRWLQKREAGEERNKNQRECVRFHKRILSLLLSTWQRRNDTWSVGNDFPTLHRFNFCVAVRNEIEIRYPDSPFYLAKQGVLGLKML
jgi:hypothetical protein